MNTNDMTSSQVKPRLSYIPALLGRYAV